MFYLDAALRHVSARFYDSCKRCLLGLEGNYTIDCEAAEPDPHIVDLNAELGQCDDFVSNSLPKKEQQYVLLNFQSLQRLTYMLSFVFAGLGHLMEHILILNARHLRRPNHLGIKKIMRNMLALQQSIKTVTNGQSNTEFERAKRYYSLFFLSPQVGTLHTIHIHRLIFGFPGNVGDNSSEAVLHFRRVSDYAESSVRSGSSRR